MWSSFRRRGRGPIPRTTRISTKSSTEHSPRRVSVLALLTRCPALADALPRIDLGVRETPVEQWTIDGISLLAKRDDLSAPLLGGNKVRALELLLAGVGPGDTVLTVGPTGS